MNEKWLIIGYLLYSYILHFTLMKYAYEGDHAEDYKGVWMCAPILAPIFTICIIGTLPEFLSELFQLLRDKILMFLKKGKRIIK